MSRQTHFLHDILRQPAEMRNAIGHLTGSGSSAFRKARSLIQSAQNVIITGIGASWHAALTASARFYLYGRPVYTLEAGELLHFAEIPRGSVIVLISRSGRSIEIVRLLAKAQAAGASVIGITNRSDSPLATESAVAIVIPAKLDHAISVVTYSTLAIAASALAGSGDASFESVAGPLIQTAQEVEAHLEKWQQEIDQSAWLATKEPYYFLARSSSIGTCNEARLLWEEGVKMPATAMSTGGFRHGPLEIVRQGMRFCLWIDQSQMREPDLTIARDLRELGASVMLIGERLPSDAGDLICELPASPQHWQFGIDVIPIQLAGERLSRMAGVDSDSFRLASHVVEDERGLLHKHSK